MLHSKQKCIIAAALLSTSSTVFAKEISYDYIQGTFAKVTVDTDTSVGDLDANGFSVSGSFSITPAIAFTASYGAINSDELLGVDIDTTQLTFGVTAHTSIAPNTDIFGNFSVLKANIEVSDGFTTIDDDDTGYAISLGLRFLATDNVELELGFERDDSFESADNSFSAGIRFHASEKLSLGIGYATADDVDALLLNARLGIK